MPDLERFDPFKLYRKHIGQDPRIEIPALAVGGAMAGRALSGGVTKLAMRLLFADLAPEKRADLMSRLDHSKIKTLGTIAGALLGGGYGAMKHMDTGMGLKGMFKSISDPGYYNKNQDRDIFRDEGRREKLDNMSYQSKESPFEMNPLKKFASLGTDPFDREVIPIRHSMRLMENDRYLDAAQRQFTSDIIYGADNSSSGLTSKHNLARSAVKMGIGFGAA